MSRRGLRQGDGVVEALVVALGEGAACGRGHCSGAACRVGSPLVRGRCGSGLLDCDASRRFGGSAGGCLGLHKAWERGSW